MFDFEKLDIYHVVKNLNTKVYIYLHENNIIEDYYKDQWIKASLSSVQNLAEGVGRVTPDEKKHFISLSRGNIFKSVAILQLIKDLKLIEEQDYGSFYDEYEKSSKMLLGMFRSIK
ncbi:MAG: four helix bundle protein [Chlorobi bacterium]|nr:four helix bundle protein [Chlorobiota bacterium]